MILCKLQRYSNGLFKAYEDHPQYKDLTDGQRENITGETSFHTGNSGGKGGISEEVERGGRDSIGEPKEGDLSKSKTITDESKRQGDNVHGDMVDMDEGQPAGTVQYELFGQDK